MTSARSKQDEEARLPPVPKRRFRHRHTQQHESVSMVGIGCSSFSPFFWTTEERHTLGGKTNCWTPETLKRSHPQVQEWIAAIHYAIGEAGITLLDTAPWYGHGTSEIVVGWGLSELFHPPPAEEESESQQQKKPVAVLRSDLIINTKVGRYEADPRFQFDFSYDKTMESVQRSLQRLQCEYIDVLQLHDPEFAPRLTVLLKDCIPAMIACQKRGWCHSLGMTGYPLEVQHQILQASLEEFGENVWDQALTYGHFNLHDTTLLHAPLSICSSSSSLAPSSCFAAFCSSLSLNCLAAAPLSMGLLTPLGPPEWHPAPSSLKDACCHAARLCYDASVDISQLALLFALSEPSIPCTILGMKNVAQVQVVQQVAARFHNNLKETLSQDQILEAILTPNERKMLQALRDKENGPFAEVWKTGQFQWNGVQQAWDFWEQLKESVHMEKWQTVKEETV